MDLSHLDEQYEKAEAGNKSRDLPAGDYIVQLTEAKVAESKEGRPYLRLSFTVVEGDLSGQKFSKIHNLDNPERFKYLKEDLYVLGVTGKLSDLEKNLSKATTKPLRVSCRVKQYNDKAYTNYYINGVVSGASEQAQDNVPF